MKELKDICRIPVKFSEIDSMRRVWHGSYVNQLCAEGETTQLFIDADGQLMVEKPAYYQDWQTRFLQTDDDKLSNSTSHE